MTQIDGRVLLSRALALVSIDADGYNPQGREQAEQIMGEFGVSRQRANTAVSKAARLKRNDLVVADSGPATFLLRVRLTERQRERLWMLAERETGGDVSALVRRRLFE